MDADDDFITFAFSARGGTSDDIGRFTSAINLLHLQNHLSEGRWLSAALSCERLYSGDREGREFWRQSEIYYGRKAGTAGRLYLINRAIEINVTPVVKRMDNWLMDLLK